MVERDVPGGQASHTSLIENFFGFPDGIGGAELARLAGRQAEGFGAELVFLRGVTGSAHGARRRSDRRSTAATRSTARRRDRRAGHGSGGGSTSTASTTLLGRGVYYGAGRSEAAQCGGDPVVVVGAGNSAGQAVMNLADAARG